MATAIDFIDLSITGLHELATKHCQMKNTRSNSIEWKFWDGSTLTVDQEKVEASKDGYTVIRRIK